MNKVCIYPRFFASLLPSFLVIDGWKPDTATAPVLDLKYFKYYGGFFNNRRESRKFVVYHKFQRKYQFFWKNLHFSWFLTYVNFSLSAKFNRFFIILGGSPEIDRDFKNRWFSRKIAIFQRKSWFSLIFQILGKIDDFKTPVAVDREELGVILISKVVIYVFFYFFIDKFEFLLFLEQEYVKN